MLWRMFMFHCFRHRRYRLARHKLSVSKWPYAVSSYRGNQRNQKTQHSSCVRGRRHVLHSNMWTSKWSIRRWNHTRWKNVLQLRVCVDPRSCKMYWHLCVPWEVMSMPSGCPRGNPPYFYQTSLPTPVSLLTIKVYSKSSNFDFNIYL